jgi:hypothetical protein
MFLNEMQKNFRILIIFTLFSGLFHLFQHFSFFTLFLNIFFKDHWKNVKLQCFWTKCKNLGNINNYSVFLAFLKFCPNFYFTGLWMFHWPLSEYRLPLNGIYESRSVINIFSDFVIFLKIFQFFYYFKIFFKKLCNYD